MHFSSYASLLAIFCGAVLCEGIVFDPILKPEQGEVIQAGSAYTIKWTSTANKPVKLTLHNQKPAGTSNDNEGTVIKDSIASKEAQYDWNVDGNITGSNNQMWYIKLALANDAETFSYSPGFKIHSNGSSSSNSSSSTTSGSSMTATGSPTGSGSASASVSPASSTSSAGGNMATALPLVLAGAAALGAFVL
ncbi:hypothetical protein N7478_009532 [Penicillium angulare]|uniref:uncharacterized protein n=1 Tax=Penicillium angulare TaxID=116970 RepID=UPI00253F8391|nr:uncharacterized protein N7478_009532 [Penicillium angulare]KAJ5266724.1 hypothetical protein N7478_009532 [Penicillium angulare]